MYIQAKYTCIYIYIPCDPVVTNRISIVRDTTKVTELVNFTGNTLEFSADKQNINAPVTIDRSPYSVKENAKAGSLE